MVTTSLFGVQYYWQMLVITMHSLLIFVAACELVNDRCVPSAICSFSSC